MMSVQASIQTLNWEDKLRGSTTARLTKSQKFLHYRNISQASVILFTGEGLPKPPPPGTQTPVSEIVQISNAKYFLLCKIPGENSWRKFPAFNDSEIVRWCYPYANVS